MTKTVAALALLASASPFAFASQPAAAAEAKPMFKVLRPHGEVHFRQHAGSPLTLKFWYGTLNYNGIAYTYEMVGTDPSKTNKTTTIKAYIIPVKMVYSKKVYGKDGRTFEPNADKWNGLTITRALAKSPLFGTMDWKWGSTDVGTTQYTDAFQRGSFWSYVGSNTNYHVVLAPTVLSEVTIKPTTAQGGAVIDNPFGTGKVGEMDLSAFDAALQQFMTRFTQINPGKLPIFVTDNVYLTSRGCCIGGYYAVLHPENTGIYQTYAYSTFITSEGAFAQDVSGFSNEIASLYDDPLLENTQTPCTGELNVTAPFGGKPNYGTFTVAYNNITWHLQTAAFLEYFGAPANFSANNWLDDQNMESQMCQDGP